MATRPLTITTLARAVGYALTALFALATGYLLRSASREWYDVLLILGLWTTTWPFSLFYANRFHPFGPAEADERVISEAKSASEWASLFLAPVFCLLSLLAYTILSNSRPPMAYLLTLLVLFILNVTYGLFLRLQRGPDPHIPMRHRLVWPAILNIGVNLYVGYIFISELRPALLLVPLGALIGFFLLTLKWNQRKFFWSGLFVSLCLVVSTFFVPEESQLFWSTMISGVAFSLGTSAYLAVFEAWSITHQLALANRHIGGEFQRAAADPSQRHYLATGFALVLAGLLLPLQYVFGDYGRIFAWGAAPHSILAFATWYLLANQRTHLIARPWREIKTAFGFFFLALLVLDASVLLLPSHRFLPNLVEGTTWTICLALAAIAFSLRYGRLASADLPELARSLSRERRGLLVAVVVIALGLSLLLLVAVEGLRSIPVSEVTLYKADRIFLYYAFVAVLASILLLGKEAWSALVEYLTGFFSKEEDAPPRKLESPKSRSDTRATQLTCKVDPERRHLGSRLGALFKAARPSTSCFVFFIVFIPAASHEIGFASAVLAAMPFSLAAAAGFLLNDSFDWQRDAINKPHRMIPLGRLAPGEAQAVATLIIVTALAVIVACDFLSVSLQATQLVAVAGAAMYNRLLSLSGYLKGFYAAGLSITPLVFLMLYVPQPSYYWLLPAAAFLFVSCRETLMDLLDEEGDRRTGLHTLVVIYGKSRSQHLAFGLGATSLVALGALMALDSTASSSLCLGGSLLASACLAFLWKYGSPARRQRLIRYAWLPMLAATAILV